MVLGVVAFVAALLVSVMLHEAGHFAFAKRFGMKATQFFVGFGPTLWSFRRGETEYGVKAIPAGGFVKIIGMTPLEEVEPGDEQRAFHRQRPWQRAIVLAAGSTVHFVIGLVVLFVIFIAYPTSPTGAAQISDVQPCVRASASASCTASSAPAPAQGKLRAGDVVTAVGDTKVSSGSDQLGKVIAAHGTKPTRFHVLRDGRRLTVTVTPVQPAGTKRPLVGIGITDQVERVDPLTAGRMTFTTFGSAIVGTFTALGHLPAQVQSLLSGQKRDLTTGGAASVVGAARLSGQAVSAGSLAVFLSLIASLNIFVGVFNLLPLLPLDGGHLAILGFEQARSKLARLTGRRDPGHLDLNKLMPAAYLVVMLFIGLSVVLLYGDIANPIANPFQ